MAGKIKPLKKEQEKELPKKKEKKEEPSKEELESKLHEKEAEEIAAREQPTLPDLEDTVEAATEAENIPTPQLEEQLDYQTAQPQQGEGYQSRPGEEKVQDQYQPKSQEIPYNTQKEQEKDYRPQHHQETAGEHEAEQILSRKLTKGYHR